MRLTFTRGRIQMGIKHEKKSTAFQGKVNYNKYKCKQSKLSCVYQTKQERQKQHAGLALVKRYLYFMLVGVKMNAKFVGSIKIPEGKRKHTLDNEN